MIARTLDRIAIAVGGELRGSNPEIRSVVTDSRRSADSALFVALRGENHDGEDFVADAMANGAVAALVARSHEGVDAEVVVADTGAALLALGADERSRMVDVRTIAITGANGKTSTKDLTAAVLSTRLRTHASPASFNNEIGVPLTVLGAPDDTEALVVELGARHEGDVETLCDIVRPEVAVVTNVGLAHMEAFGSWDAIVRSGAEPVRALPRGGCAILNADDPVVRAYRGETVARVVTFGLADDADVRGESVSLDGEGRASFTLSVDGSREPVALAVPGEHMVSNALAAAAVGTVLGLSTAECAAALKDAHVSRWRMQPSVTSSGLRLLNDAYNANPESMAAGLRAARWIARDVKMIAVLGHMAELGPVSFEEHERVGRLAIRLGVDRLITVGEQARVIARAAVREGAIPGEVVDVDTPEQAVEDVRAHAGDGDVVFIKGSRVAGLERVAEALA